MKTIASTSGAKSRPDKRQAIMQAAESLFTSRRLHEITLDDVARDAQVGKGTIYRYFRDKDDLFFQTATQGFDELCELLHKRVPDDAPFAEQLTGACREISGFFQRRRQLCSMMQTEEGRMSWCRGSARQQWVERRKKLHSAVAAIIIKGVSESAVRKDIDPDIMALLLMGMLKTRAREMSDISAQQPSLESIVQIFVDGVTSNSASTRQQRSKL